MFSNFQANINIPMGALLPGAGQPPKRKESTEPEEVRILCGHLTRTPRIKYVFCSPVTFHSVMSQENIHFIRITRKHK